MIQDAYNAGYAPKVTRPEIDHLLRDTSRIGIFQTIESTQKELELLSNSITMLVDRVSPVVRTYPEEAMIEKESSFNQNYSTVNANIVDLRTKICRLNRVVASILDNLDI